MKRFRDSIVAFTCCWLISNVARPDEQPARAILDKAIKALGGEANLKKAAMATWKGKGKIHYGGQEGEFSTRTTVQGLDHYRAEFEGEFNGNKVQGLVVLNGDRCWQKTGGPTMEMHGDLLANARFTVYLQFIPFALVPLKGPKFKIETAGEERVGDATASVLKVTAPDGKDFKLYFDKESGLPLKSVATVLGLMGEEFLQEESFRNYQNFDGIKKATRFSTTRDGQRFVESEITEFKVLDKIDSGTFDEPE